MVELQAISSRLARGEIDGARYLEQLMRFVSGRIGCSRSALRVFVDAEGGRVLRTVALHDALRDRMTSAPDIRGLDDSTYVEELRRRGSIAIDDVDTDPRAAGTLRDYLDDAGVRSLLDVAFAVNGVLCGTFSCERADAGTAWSPPQVRQLRSIASRASLALMHLVHAVADTAPGALWDTSLPNRLATMPAPLDPLSRE